MLAAVDRDGNAGDALRLREIQDRGGDVLRARPVLERQGRRLGGELLRSAAGSAALGLAPALTRTRGASACASVTVALCSALLLKLYEKKRGVGRSTR